MSDLTSQQTAAVRHRGPSVVLAAGAGCGKTTVLTARYLSHLRDDGATVPQVTAITFTERAAREMRGRIRQAVDAEVAMAPGSMWEQHRRDLDTAPIDTIHGYCGRLLRRFPAGGLPTGFRVFDDPQANALRAEATRAELHRLLTGDEPAGDDLRELAALFGWSAAVEAVDGLLDSPDRAGWQRWEVADVAAGWLARHASLVPEWLAYQSAAGGKLAVALRTLGRLAVPEPGAERVRAVLDAFAGDGSGLAGLNDVAKVQGLKKGWADPAVHEAVKDAFSAVRDGLKGFEELTADPTDWPASVEVGRRFLRVAAAADDAYCRAKRKAGGADFHDLLACARDLLRDNSAARAAVQAETRFLLVDEFQDTDPVQLELVKLAVGDGYQSGRLFAVGDRKQSIYRFRGAEVALFESLQADLPTLPLTENFRSQPGVIGFVNALFRRRLPGYEPLTARRPQADGANVEFLWAVPAAPDGKEPVEAVRAREADAIARRLVELIDGGVKPGNVTILFRAMSHVGIYEAALRRHGLDYYVVGGRAFFAQQEVHDLANLLAAVENPHDGPALAGALRSPACGLPDDALHLLPTHKDGLWAGLHDDSRLSLLGADRPAAERARDRFTGWRAAKDRLPVAGLVERVFAESGFDAATQFEPLADRKLANLWKLVGQARRFDADGFALADFVRWLGGSVTEGVREEQAATVPERADDVVRLMSIHKAKGLEFAVVVVPDLGAMGGGDRHPVARWHRELGCVVRHPSDLSEADDDEPPFPDGPHRLGRAVDELADWQEGLRVLYVATTRARDRLILSAGLTAEPTAPVSGVPPVPPAKAASGWLLALSEQYHLLTGECVAGDGPRVAVRLARPGGEVKASFREPAAPLSPLAVAAVPFVFPPLVSLGALQAVAAGDDLRTIAVGPKPSLTARLAGWVLARWDFADRDGWRSLLAEALADDPTADPARDEVADLFERFANEPRRRLAGQGVVWRAAELLLEPAAVAGDALVNLPPGLALSGRIDLFTKDGAGWHLWAVHLSERPGRDPWADARPWLGLLAAAAKTATGEPVRSVGLLDAVSGEVHTADARKLLPAAGLAAVGSALRRWVGA